MANIDFEGFSLQTANYITTDITYRTIPTRDIVLQNISRRPGKKMTANEFTQKEIKIAGWILGDNGDDLIAKIDDLHDNITRKNSGILTVDNGRSIAAIVNTFSITDPNYTQSATPFEIDFLSTGDPFWSGPQQSINITVASGNEEPQILPVTLTISGSVFAEPMISYRSSGSTGYTTTSGIMLQYGSTQEKLTWSGGANTLPYGSLVAFDYSNLIAIQDSVEVVAAGNFSRWEPGLTNFGVTFSGCSQGGTLTFAYHPRYL